METKQPMMESRHIKTNYHGKLLKVTSRGNI